MTSVSLILMFHEEVLGNNLSAFLVDGFLLPAV